MSSVEKQSICFSSTVNLPTLSTEFTSKFIAALTAFKHSIFVSYQEEERF